MPLSGAWTVAVVAVTVHVVTGLAAASTLRRVGVATALALDRPPWLRLAAGGQEIGHLSDGEVWRLATSVFVHADALHLSLNVVALLALGRLIEPFVGTWRWLSWFAAGGLAGSVATWWAGVHVSDGASGGAFALLGAAVVLGWRWRHVLPSADRRLLGPVLWILLALNLVAPVVVPAINPVAHAGGLTAGILVAVLPGHRIVRAAESTLLVTFAASCLYGWTRLLTADH